MYKSCYVYLTHAVFTAPQDYTFSTACTLFTQQFFFCKWLKHPYFLSSHSHLLLFHPCSSVPPSCILSHSTVTFFLLEIKKGAAESKTSDSTEHSSQSEPPGDLRTRLNASGALGGKGGEDGWKSGSWAVQTPPLSFHPSVESLTPQSLSRLFGAQLLLWFITFRRAWASQTSSAQHGGAGRCLFSYFIHSYFV